MSSAAERSDATNQQTLQPAAANEPLLAAQQLIHGLVAQNLRVATAESLTGGGVCAALASVAGASHALQGGACVYNAEIKHDVIGVPSELIAQHGTVAPDIAAALATGARQVFHADMGIGTTGVAGPDELEGHPVGTVYVGVATANVVKTRALHLRGERNEIRAAAVAAALQLALDVLGG